MGTAFERLSSGMRINSAADDAAGLAIASDLDVRSRIATQGIRNVNDGISFLSIAEGGISSLVAIITRQKELAAQAANGSYSLKQRQALDTEARALTDEYNRIVSSTTFNGVNVFGAEDVAIQSGIGALETTLINTGLFVQRATAAGSGVAGTGAFGATALSPGGGGGWVAGGGLVIADFDGDGDNDVARTTQANSTGGSIDIFSNDGTGTLTFTQANGTDLGPRSIALGDFNKDGDPDIATAVNAGLGTLHVFLGGSGTTFTNVTVSTGSGNNDLNSVGVGDFNGDSNDDVAFLDAGGFVKIHLGNGDGTFQASVSFDISPLSNLGTNLAVLDFNGDGRDDLAFAVDSRISLFSNSGGATFAASSSFATPSSQTLIARDVTGDGLTDLATISSLTTASLFCATGSGTFAAVQTITFDGSLQSIDFADINQDGQQDIVGFTVNDLAWRTKFGDGTGSFAADISTASGVSFVTTMDFNLALGDLDGDGVPDVAANNRLFAPQLLSALSTTDSSSGSAGLSTELSHIDLTTVETAREALDSRSAVLDGLTSAQGAVGAYQARLESVVRRLQSVYVEYAAARSRILDVDVAAETAELIAQNVRREVGSAILAQANSQSSLVLKLLDG